MNVLQNNHMITIRNMIDSYKSWLVGVKLVSFDRFELEDITNSWLLIESHLPNLFKQSFKLDLVIWNSSTSALDLFYLWCQDSLTLDIEGAKLVLVSLSLSSYCGENVTDCATGSTNYQAYVKWICSSCATGSFLLGKFTHMSCEYFNWKVYNLLYRVRDMEHKCKLTDPKIIIFDPKYRELGPLGLVAVLVEWHSNLLANRMWTALTALPSSIKSGIIS